MNEFRNFYGRIQGKKLRPKQQDRMDNLLPKITVPTDQIVDMDALFGNSGPYWLEIGFGAGEHLAAIARANPDVGIIGAEPYRNGVAAFLRYVDEDAIENVRVHAWDVRALFDALPNQIFDRVYLLYPDPWPKARHAERRFMNPDNLKQLARLMRPGAELRHASDIVEYIEHGLEAVGKTDEFERLEHPIDQPWEGWHRTRYETKALREGRNPHYLRFQRRPLEDQTQDD